MSQSRFDQAALLQTGLFVVVSTLTMTATFLGIVGLVTGAVTGLDLRLPFYVLAMAVAFVGTILLMEQGYRSGEQVLRTATGVSLVTLVVVTLGGEGVAFLIQRPETVVSSQSLFYLLAAGLIGSGLGYWGLRHWDELRQARSF